METARIRRSRVSRETRLVVLTALIALVALWILARIRYPVIAGERAAPQVLTPLAARPAFDAFAIRAAAASNVAAPRLLGIEIARPPIAQEGARSPRAPGWRFRDDLVLVHLPASARPVLNAPATLVAHNPTLELAVVRVQHGPIAPVASTWTETLQPEPRFVLATDTLAGGVSLRPVWIGGADPIESPLWSATVFEVPFGTNLSPGDLVFDSDGDWLGLSIAHGAHVAVVPAATVAREAEQLLTRAGQPAADLRIEVQELASATSRATGATTGLIVSWVGRSGPANSVIVPGDVIESADGQPFPTVDHWLRYVSRLVVGSPTSLRVRRRGEVREVTVTPAPTAPPESAGAPRTARTRLGVVMRFIPGSGSEVTAVEPESIGAAAGLEPGDVITWIGSLSSPEPLQIRQATTAAEPGRPVLVGIQRGTRHRVTTFER